MVSDCGRGRFSDALQDYLSPASAPSTAWKGRATTFLQMYGGTFDASHALTNRARLITSFSNKIQIFACNYLASRVKDAPLTFDVANTAADYVIPTAQEVATAFVDALEDSNKTGNTIEAKRFPTPGGKGTKACGQQLWAARIGKIF